MRASFLFLLFLAGSQALGATLTFGTSAPAATSDTISSSVGATFDADNVGGSGVNADGGANNGGTNDGTTYVAGNRPAQGETFITGTNAGGYTLSSVTVRMQGYTNNIATGANTGSYDLNTTTSNFSVRVGEVSGTTFIPMTVEYALSGGTGNPGQGNSAANGPGTYLTFTLKAPIVLAPNKVYAFDLGTSGDYFEMLGIRNGAVGGNPYSSGTAYTSGTNGAGSNGMTMAAGDRVFQVNLTAYTPPAPGIFVHPGLLNTEADFKRMRTNVALGVEPWLSNYNALKSSWMANTGWPSHAQATITRGSFNDSSRLYNDIAVAYSCALVWKISGDTAYADEAVRILNAWAYTFTSIAGDTNIALNELYGCQFAVVAEMMRNYQGWAPADLAQFQTMIYNVFYSLADSFLTSHFGTGDSHYWANWDLASMSTLYAIGVLNDNPALVTRSLNYFYSGVGNGCIDRAVNFIHPGYLGQGQEMGRDQGHATLDIAQLAAYCQMAWNQGTDLFGYENNRVLSMAEYTAKYNLGNDVPWTNYGYDVYWPTVWLQTGVSSGSRGDNQRPGWPTLYNHYVNVMGLSAPYTKQMANNMGTNWGYNGDLLGWDQLTTALPPIAPGTNPSALSAVLNGQQPRLSWWGSAYATSYNVKRSTTAGGPYTTIASGVTTNTYTDTNPVAGVTNYYVVTGSLSGGGETGVSNETAVILGVPLLAQLNFNETSGSTAADTSGTWTGTLVNGVTWTTGTHGNAVNLSKASSQYVSLPAGIVADVSDMTISAWVYQTSASNYATIFSFGSGDNFYGGWSPWNYPTWLAERYMYLNPQDGNGKVRFGISRSTSVGEESIEGASALPTGQWVHVTVTLSAGIGTLYVNGIAVGQSLNMPMTPMQFPPTTQNYIGRSQGRGDPYFDGKIDDFRIYRGALTTGQAYTLATGLAPATPPPAPTNLTVTAQPGNQNSLSWTASPGATSYTVLRATTPGGPYTTIATIVTGTSYVDTGATAGTTYYYEVDGANTGGDGSASLQSSGVTALPPLPSVPTGLNAVATSSRSITLNWTAAANAYTYNVGRSLTSGGPYTTIAAGLLNPTLTDTNVIAGTTYYYVASSVNTAGTSANSLEDSAAPSDLILHTRFDEGAGVTAADVSGNGWDAALVNGPAWTAGLFGNAINLTATASQSAALPANVVAGVNDFSISVWVKMNSFGAFSRIFDFGTGTTNYMFLTPQYTTTAPNAAKPRFAIRTAAIAEQQLNSSIALPLNTWTNVTVTLTGSTGRMYIGGALAATNTAMTLNPASLGSTTLNYFGRSQFAADPYLDGSLDDVRIYSRALSAAEISGLVNPPPQVPVGLAGIPGDGQATLNWAVDESASTYTVKRSTFSGGPYTIVSGSSGLTSPTFTDTGLTNGTPYYYVVSAANWLGTSSNSAEASVTPSYLRLLLNFDETSGTTAADSSGRGSNAILFNAPAWTAGEINNAVTLASASSQYAALPAGIVNGLTDFTISTWVKVAAFSTQGRIFDFGNGTTPGATVGGYMFLTPQYTTGANAAKLRYAITTAGYNNEQAIASSTAFTTGTWVHVAVTLTGSTGRLYLNGTQVGINSAMTLTPSSLGSTTLNYLGRSQFAADPYLNGSLDDFRIYSRAMTPAEVALAATPLTAPQGVQAITGTSGILLNWNTVVNAASYNVKRSLTSGGPYTTIASGVITNAFTDTGLAYGTTYFYVITAANITGESANSNELTATSLSTPFTKSEGNTPNLAMPNPPGSGVATLTSATSVAGHSYQLQSSTNLAPGSWVNVGDPLAGTGSPLIFQLNTDPHASRYFYRILISR